MNFSGARGGGAGEADGDVGFAGDDLAAAVTGPVELPFPGDGDAASVEGGEESPFPVALILGGERNNGEVQLDEVVTLAFRFECKSCIVPYAPLLCLTVFKTKQHGERVAVRLEPMVDELDDLDHTISINVRGIAATTKLATLMSRNCGECPYDNGAGHVMVMVRWVPMMVRW
ncbi:hypothetical protein V8G54_031936 [Vigna mungo]|uniref:Uncharacterized protein n=1 Tax=Vigna mungo TaxID=3915 RepID=A0AAQ3RHE2_VIGMU